MYSTVVVSRVYFTSDIRKKVTTFYVATFNWEPPECDKMWMTSRFGDEGGRPVRAGGMRKPTELF